MEENQKRDFLKKAIDFLEKFYTIVFKKIWPLWVGGIMLAVLNILFLLLSGNAWSITTGFAYWGAWIVGALGGDPGGWSYFQGGYREIGVGQCFWCNDLSLISLGVILGAFLSVLLSGQFKIKKIKTPKQATVALVGGIIMGYATRLALGCNIGAFFSAVPSLSLSGYVFGVFVVLGAWLGSKFLVRYLL